MIRTCHITTVDASLANLLADRLNSLKKYNYSIHTASSVGSHRKKILDAGLSHSEITNLTRRWDIVADFKSIVEMYNYLRNSQFDIVNTYSPKAGIYGRIAAHYAGIPIVVHTSWGLFFSEDSPLHKKMLHLSLEFAAAKHCNHIFSVNRDDIDLMVKYRLKNINNITYLGNGTDLNHFQPKHRMKSLSIKQQFNIPDKKIVVGIVGRVVKEKGYDEFISAANELKKKHQNVEFISIGSMDLDKSDSLSLEKIKVIEGRGSVRFLGYQTDMRSIYSMMDIVVLPSYREGHPRSLVEACAMGIPIITTNTRGCKEAVENDYNGFLVPLKDSKSLEEKIDILIKDSAKRSIFGVHSRKKAEKDYDQEKLVKKIADVYEKLVRTNNMMINEKFKCLKQEIS